MKDGTSESSLLELQVRRWCFLREIQAGFWISLAQCEQFQIISSFLWYHLAGKHRYYPEIFRTTAEKGFGRGFGIPVIFNWIILVPERIPGVVKWLLLLEHP